MTSNTTATAPAATAQGASTLDATDRCDRCGAQAYAMALISVDDKQVELHFCAHHLREHRSALGDRVAVDETHRLASGNRQQGKSY